MANNASAIKRIRQTERRNARNRAARSALRTQIRKLRTAASEGNQEEAAKLLPGALALLDRSAGRGVIHANAAARSKSRLVKLVNSIEA